MEEREDETYVFKAAKACVEENPGAVSLDARNPHQRLQLELDSEGEAWVKCGCAKEKADNVMGARLEADRRQRGFHLEVFQECNCVFQT